MPVFITGACIDSNGERSWPEAALVGVGTAKNRQTVFWAHTPISPRTDEVFSKVYPQAQPQDLPGVVRPGDLLTLAHHFRRGADEIILVWVHVKHSLPYPRGHARHLRCLQQSWGANFFRPFPQSSHIPRADTLAMSAEMSRRAGSPKRPRLKFR